MVVRISATHSSMITEKGTWLASSWANPSFFDTLLAWMVREPSVSWLRGTRQCLAGDATNWKAEQAIRPAGGASGSLGRQPHDSGVQKHRAYSSQSSKHNSETLARSWIMLVKHSMGPAIALPQTT